MIKQTMMQQLKVSSVLVGFSLLAGISSGCATQAQKEVDRDLAKTPAVTSPQQLQAETAAKIEDDPRLTAEQRTKLKTLQTNLREQYEGFKNESLKLRSLLVDQLLAKNYKPREVANIKGRIRKVEENRLAAMFKAVDEVTEVLGHNEDNTANDMQRRRSMENLLVSPSMM